MFKQVMTLSFQNLFVAVGAIQSDTWKSKCSSEMGIETQCQLPSTLRINAHALVRLVPTLSILTVWLQWTRVHAPDL